MHGWCDTLVGAHCVFLHFLLFLPSNIALWCASCQFSVRVEYAMSNRYMADDTQILLTAVYVYHHTLSIYIMPGM